MRPLTQAEAQAPLLDAEDRAYLKALAARTPWPTTRHVQRGPQRAGQDARTPHGGAQPHPTTSVAPDPVTVRHTQGAPTGVGGAHGGVDSKARMPRTPCTGPIGSTAVTPNLSP